MTNNYKHQMTHNPEEDLLDKINRRSRTGPCLAALKIDMSKAYDRVHWGFLLSVLQAFGFSDWLVQLIHQCISTVSFQTVVNGCSSPQF